MYEGFITLRATWSWFCIGFGRGVPVSLCVVLLTVSFVVFAEESGPNLLANPSFEAGMAEGGVPAGWTLYGGLDDLRHLALVDDPLDGAKALQLADGHPTQELGIRQTVAAEGGNAYIASVSVKLVEGQSPAGSYLQLRFLPSNEFVQRPLIPGLAGAAADIRVGKIAPPGTTEATIYLYTHTTPTPTVILDHAQLYTVAELPPEALAPSGPEVPEIEALKPLYLDTPLVAGGAAIAIVAPAGREYDAGAKVIADAIETAGGVRPAVVTDDAYAGTLALDSDLIALGNRSTNRLLGALYERYYTLLDLRYPGPGGYVVRTLHNPLGNGKNVVLVGGSDAAGVTAAAAHLAQTISASGVKTDTGLTIGRLMDIKLGDGVVVPTDLKAFETWDASAGYGSVGYFGWNSISKRMAMYYMTGDESQAREVIRLAFPDEQAKQEIAEIDGERIENKDEPFSGPYHYNAHLMVLFWDLIEESPVFTDGERLAVTRALAKQPDSSRCRRHEVFSFRGIWQYNFQRVSRLCLHSPALAPGVIRVKPVCSLRQIFDLKLPMFIGLGDSEGFIDVFSPDTLYFDHIAWYSFPVGFSDHAGNTESTRTELQANVVYYLARSECDGSIRIDILDEPGFGRPKVNFIGSSGDIGKQEVSVVVRRVR